MDKVFGIVTGMLALEALFGIAMILVSATSAVTDVLKKVRNSLRTPYNSASLRTIFSTSVKKTIA